MNRMSTQIAVEHHLKYNSETLWDKEKKNTSWLLATTTDMDIY